MKILICTFGNTNHYACRLFYSILSNIADVKLFFFNSIWDKNTEDFINGYIQDEAPDLIAVSLLTFELDLCKKLVKAVRRLRTSEETKIIFGGPYTFLAAESCLKIADFVCTGEGEYTLVEICNEFNKSKKWEKISFDHIPNLLYLQNNYVHKSDVQDLYYSRPYIDTFPFPAYGEEGIYVYDGLKWQGDISIKNDFYYAFASRGCPYMCTYCINAVHKMRKITLRSPNKVIEELKSILTKNPNLKTINFIDEIFCWDGKWAREFGRLYKEQIALPFECDSFPGRHSEEVIKILADAGLKKVNVGVQSCSKRILDEIFMRPQKIESILNDNKTYHKYNILPTYDFIVDNPFETSIDLLETVEVVKKLQRPTFFRIYSLFFFPYHLLTQRAEKEGLYKTEDQNKNIYYDKITTTHKGDQYCKKLWYTKPFKSISSKDKKPH